MKKENKSKWTTVRVLRITLDDIERMGKMEQRSNPTMVSRAVKLYHETMFKKRNW